MSLMSSYVVRIGSRFNLTPFIVPVRNLFSKEELGVKQIEQLQKNTRQNFQKDNEIEFYLKWFDNNFPKLSLNEKRDNLKQYILLIDGKPDELEKLKSYLMEYQNTYNNSVHHVREFVFGTPIMRLLYLWNLPDEAIKFYKDVHLRIYFEQMQTYKVLLSLLFENKRYAEVFDLYKDIRTHLSLHELFPDITLNCLAFGACYKLNTPYHYQYARDLWTQTKHLYPLRRSKNFLAALAVNQNEPAVALNLLPEESFYVTVRFIKIAAFTKSGDFDKACDMLSQTIRNYKLNSLKTKPMFGKQMIEDLRDAIQKSGTNTQLIELDKIYDELKSLELINDETLDERLSATFPPMLPKNVFLKMKRKTAKIN